MIHIFFKVQIITTWRRPVGNSKSTCRSLEWRLSRFSGKSSSGRRWRLSKFWISACAIHKSLYSVSVFKACKVPFKVKWSYVLVIVRFELMSLVVDLIGGSHLPYQNVALGVTRIHPVTVEPRAVHCSWLRCWCRHQRMSCLRVCQEVIKSPFLLSFWPEVAKR